MGRGGCELAQCTVSVVAQKACIIADSGKLMNSKPCVLSGVGEMGTACPQCYQILRGVSIKPVYCEYKHEYKSDF